MATSNHNTGRTLPAGGVDGEVLTVDTTTPTDVKWGAATTTAGNVTFTNPSAATGDWPGADPTTVAQALNLLAARLNALEA